MDHKELAAEIVKNVGGEENIKSVSHCMTRLRFILQDVQKADKDALENLKGVLGVIYAGGQYMVILGQILLPVYEHVLKDFHIADGGSIDENLDEIKEKEPLSVKTVFNGMIGYVSAAVTPLIPGLIAGGMMKVVLLLIVTFINPDFAATSSYSLLAAIGDAPFFFMPIIVAYGAAVKLGATPVYAMVAAAALLHGNYTTLVASGEPITLFSIVVRPLSYGTSLLPALLIALVAYYAEKFLNKIIPGIFRSVFVGMGTIFVAGSLGYLILGPLGNMLGQGIAAVFLFLGDTVGPVATGLLAGCLPWLVMAGMHTAVAPFMTQLLTNPGYDSMIRPAFLLHNMAEGGAVLGVAARTKDKEFRSECLSIAVGCIVAGVTEPAIYGVNLIYKKPMIGVMAGGFAGGFIASLLGIKAYVLGYSNIIALPIFQETVGAAVVGVLTAIIVAAIVTFVLGIEESDKKKALTPAVTKTYADDEIVAVTDGQMIPLEDVKDEAFASKALGDGVAFLPDSDYICAPANGVLSALFPTGHAFGITMNDGTELLVHIGINTVELNGEGFDTLLSQGDPVRAGQPVVRIDRNLIQKKGYDTTTMLIITNNAGERSGFQDFGAVKQGNVLK